MSETTEPEPASAARLAMNSVVPTYMSETSAALYARWWQLETWLRELVYVELRARFGVKWVDTVRAASGRQDQDAIYTHMAAADTQNPLAYLDYSQLLQIIDNNWGMFSRVLLEQESWKGHQPALKRIRHRIGHMRRPHSDDLTRVEQVLRDLERGAFIACASYNDDLWPDPDVHHDPVTTGWIGVQHEVASRLLDHAARNYGVRAAFRVSRRPGVSMPAELDGAAGLLWHVDYFCRDGGFDAAAMWRDGQLDRARQLFVHMIARDPHHFRFTFTSIDDPVAVADAIGDTFDVLLSNRLYGTFDYHEIDSWHAKIANIDYRLQTNSSWAIVDPTTLPISMFACGGSVTTRPRW